MTLRVLRRLSFPVLLLAMLAGGKATAQTLTKPVSVKGSGFVEEFNVLTTDKSVRHGSYVKYRPANPLSGLIMFAAGSYAQGLKEGEWRTFYDFYPWNKLSSHGSYHAGQEEGLWQYYHPSAQPASSDLVALPKGASVKDGFSVDLDDTTAVLEAKGMYSSGRRIGLWTYYDALGRPIQKVNHSTGQLLYWQQDSSRQFSGAALALNHPLLYVGGKAELRREIFRALRIKVPMSLSQTGSAEFVLSIDQNGHPTQVTPVTPAASAKAVKYQATVGSALQLLTDWLPQITDGQPVAADYRVKIAFTHFKEANREGVKLDVDLLGN
jgi:hypothetical protein